MDPIRTETTKLAEMIMCGDSPLACKADLNTKTSETRDKGEKERTHLSHADNTPNGSPDSAIRRKSEQEFKSARSIHALMHNTQILHAAAAGSRWAPYQLAGWALLVLTAHALSAFIDLLNAAIPPLRRLCDYCCGFAARRWTQCGRARWCGASAGVAGGALWLTYGVLNAARAAALWAVQPMATPITDSTDD
ncbi:uncharacterized protein LOC121735699 isoform X2 [Aricia agestis]|uniref:uncharacterized protein LOC121735699 isoform X2 n=1 Tax=Aricia agestis TaxID=91739 RepID=UPI001C20A201|nr:uncharacterized protein LOC121735699 isoform X2 [Aricia agestis]